MLNSEEIFESISELDDRYVIDSEKKVNRSAKIITFAFAFVSVAVVCLVLISSINSTFYVDKEQYEQGGGNVMTETTTSGVCGIYKLIKYNESVYEYQDKYEGILSELVIIVKDYKIEGECATEADIYVINYDSNEKIVVKFDGYDGYYIYSMQQE